MMTDEAVSQHLEELPLFPLPGAVLFPHMRMPLHVFEPRYRAMIRDARREGLPIAIGLLKASWSPSSEPPPVHSVAGVGVIDKLEELPDGRFLIELVGQTRVRIVEEKDSRRPYRVVVGEEVGDAPIDPRMGLRAMQRLKSLILGMHPQEPHVAGVLATVISGIESPGDAADSIAAVLHTDPRTRQDWLEETDPVARLEAITESLEIFVALAQRARGEVN